MTATAPYGTVIKLTSDVYASAWEKLLGFGLAVSDTKRDAAHRAALLDELAHLMFDAGQLEQALSTGQQAVKQASAAGTLASLARVSGLVANILLRQGQTEAATDLLKQTEPLWIFRPVAAVERVVE